MIDGVALIARLLRGEPVGWPANAADMTILLETAVEHGMTALVARCPAVASWPEKIQAPLRDACRAEIAVEPIRRDELYQVLSGLTTAGVQPLVMKGAHLAYAWYPQPWLRPYVDVDLLIQSADAHAADGALSRLGYRPTTHFSGSLVTHQFEYWRLDRYGLRHVIDMHTKIANPQLFAHLLTYDELLADAEPIPAFGELAHAPSTRNALLLTFIHRVAHHYSSRRLIWLYDAHVLLRGMADQEVDRFAELAAEKRVRRICLDGLAEVRARFGTEISQEAIDALATQSDAGVEPTAAFAAGARSQFRILLSDLRALRGWRAKLVLVREHLFPPAAYMRHRYGFSHPILLPAAYAHGILAGVTKWFRGLDST